MGAHKAQTAGRCIFCQKPGNLSKQHVLPDRIKKLVPREGTSHDGRHTFSEGIAPFAPMRTEPIRRQGAFGTRKHRIVCKTCNEGWMNTAETAAFDVISPLIQGAVFASIGPDEARKIALLAAIIFPMLARDHLSTDAINQEERSFIFEKQEPPAKWFVFCGKIESHRWRLRTRHHAFTLLNKSPVSRNEPKNAQVSTVGVGKFLLHCVSAQTLEVITKPAFYAERLGLLAVHPHGGETIHWTAMPALSDAQIERIADATKEVGERNALRMRAGFTA